MEVLRLCNNSSLVPRLPRSGTRTMKLCRRYLHSGRAWERGYNNSALSSICLIPMQYIDASERDCSH